MSRDPQGIPYRIVDVQTAAGTRSSFVVKLYRQNQVSIARRAIDDDEFVPSLGFDAVWDPNRKLVYSSAGQNWERDIESAPMRQSLGDAFPEAVTAWSTALASLEL